MDSSAVIKPCDKQRSVHGVPIPAEYRPVYNDPLLRSSTEEEDHSRLALKQKMMNSLEDGKCFPPWTPTTTRNRGTHHGQYSCDARNVRLNCHSKHRHNGQAVFSLFQVDGATLDPLSYETKAPKSLGFGKTFDNAANQKTSYVLNGPSFAGIPSPIDFFMPQFKTYPNAQAEIINVAQRRVQDPPVRHLDVSSTWRGLSTDNAEELSLWEFSFRLCIERIIRPFLQHLDARRGVQDGGDFVPFSIHIPSLVRDMVAEFSANTSALNWFASATNVYDQVALFVKMHDCFVVPPGFFADPPKKPEVVAIHVRVRREGLLLPETGHKLAELKWHPGRIVFEDFNPLSTEGQNLYLRPRYFDALSDSWSERLSTQVKFSTPCDWLSYDTAAGYFKGTIPNLSQTEKVTFIPIIIKATMRQYFCGRVTYFEQQIRVRVNVTIEREETDPTLRNVGTGLLGNISGTCPTGTNRSRHRTSKTVRFALPEKSNYKKATSLRSLPIRLKKETTDGSKAESESISLATGENSAQSQIFGAWRLSETAGQQLPMIQLKRCLKSSLSSAVTDNVVGGSLSLGHISSTAEWQPLELSNKFDLLSGRSDMDRPTEEASTGSPVDMEAFGSESNSDANEDIAKTFVEMGNQMNPTLFESVRTAFRAAWNERQRGSPRRSRSSTCISDTGVGGNLAQSTIHDRQSETKSYAGMARSQTPKSKSPRTAFSLESNRTSPSTTAFMEKLSALEAQAGKGQGPAIPCLPKKAFKTALEIEFGSEEDPRDVREMKKDILRCELKKMEQRMIGGLGIGKWETSEVEESEDFGDGLLSSIDESMDLL